jgi:uncharacterized protein YecA (UPF0149 family)
VPRAKDKTTGPILAAFMAFSQAMAEGDDSIPPKDLAEVVENLPQAIGVLADAKFRIPWAGFEAPVRSDKVGRNEPCPCGSGRKYKKCCGAAV